VNLNQGIYLFDKDWNIVLKDVWKQNYYNPTEINSVADKMLSVQSHIELDPGSYNLAIEFKDDSSGNIGAMHSTMTIESFRYDSLQVSDLLLARNIEPKQTVQDISIDNIKYTPNIDRTYKKPQNIFLYFEIYNLYINGEQGNSKYQLEYSVRYKKSGKDKEWSIGNALGRLFSFSRNRFELATTAEYSGNTPVEKMYIEIDPSSLNPGMCLLTLKVTDLISKQIAIRQTIFYLKE
jgi:hypothetical protein